jgi:hypothetical protein
VAVRDRTFRSRNRFIFRRQRELIETGRRQRVFGKVIQGKHRHRYENVIGEFHYIRSQQWANDKFRTIGNCSCVRRTRSAFSVHVIDANRLPIVQAPGCREIGAEKSVLNGFACALISAG